MKIEFKDGALIVMTSQGKLLITEDKENVEVSLNVDNNNDDLHIRLNRLNKIKKFRSGKLKATKDVCNPYIGVWALDEFITYDLVKYSLTKEKIKRVEE